MNQIEIYKQATEQFTDLVEQIDDSQWGGTTPCADWSVRDLVNHVVGEALWIAPLFEGKTIAEVGSALDGDILGDDPKQTWRQARNSALQILDQPGVLAKTVHLSYGDQTGTQYMEPMAIDAIIHAWDLAAAIGADRKINSDLVDYALKAVQEMLAKYGRGGFFGPEFQLTSEQSQDHQNQLLALTGHNPNWHA